MNDYRNLKVMLGLSAGINSMAVLCWLANYEYKPKDIYIFYAHFEEHSPDSLKFVLAGVEYAKKHFDNVIYEQTNNSVLEFFRSENIIPHPTIAPCTYELKIKESTRFSMKYDCSIDLVGYVRSEKRRVKNMLSKNSNNLFLTKEFPILEMSDADCFDIVEKQIGWYPKIYYLRWNDEDFVNFVKSQLHRFEPDTPKKLLKKCGTDKPVFSHNNCLPCKNMQIDDMLCVEYFYPDFFKKAIDLSRDLQKHWGRNKDNFTDAFMVTFGREDWETEKICEICNF